MNREELKRQAEARRARESAPSTRTTGWVCEYCSRVFVRESAFMNHRCPDKLKLDLLKSADGQNAFAYYNLWMKEQGRSEQSIETFIESRLFSTFIKFAQYTRRTNLPKVGDYIRFMVQQKLSPTMWTSDALYSAYLQKYDSIIPPEQQFTQSAEELHQLAIDLGVKLPRIFEALGPADLINLIRRRKLSFWFLLASSKFRSYMLSLPAEDRERIAAAINIGAANNRIQSERELFKEFSEATKELGL